MSSKPKLRFSVVIPCYNEEAYIGATLESLYKQDFDGSYEVIVVDNNCTDKTVTIAKEYGVTLVTEKNPGVCWARQAGTAVAQGEIVISSDADTTFDTDWLTSIDSLYTKNPQIVAAGGPCSFTDGPWWSKVHCTIVFGGTHLLYRLFGRVVYFTATNTSFKRELFDGYNTTLTQGGDEWGVLNGMRKKGPVMFTNTYTVHTSSRRLERGMWYNMFVVVGYYYTLAYFMNKIFGRTIIGSAPVERPQILKDVKGAITRARATVLYGKKSILRKGSELQSAYKKSGKK